MVYPGPGDGMNGALYRMNRSIVDPSCSENCEKSTPGPRETKGLNNQRRIKVADKNL